jgi:hypothetical protein
MNKANKISPLEWLERKVRLENTPVRRDVALDPWLSSDRAAENDTLTERRRGKLETLSLNEESGLCNERGESVA